MPSPNPSPSPAQDVHPFASSSEYIYIPPELESLGIFQAEQLPLFENEEGEGAFLSAPLSKEVLESVLALTTGVRLATYPQTVQEAALQLKYEALHSHYGGEFPADRRQPNPPTSTRSHRNQPWSSRLMTGLGISTTPRHSDQHHQADPQPGSADAPITVPDSPESASPRTLVYVARRLADGTPVLQAIHLPLPNGRSVLGGGGVGRATNMSSNDPRTPTRRGQGSDALPRTPFEQVPRRVPNRHVPPYNQARPRLLVPGQRVHSQAVLPPLGAQLPPPPRYLFTERPGRLPLSPQQPNSERLGSERPSHQQTSYQRRPDHQQPTSVPPNSHQSLLQPPLQAPSQRPSTQQPPERPLSHEPPSLSRAVERFFAQDIVSRPMTMPPRSPSQAYPSNPPKATLKGWSSSNKDKRNTLSRMLHLTDKFKPKHTTSSEARFQLEPTPSDESYSERIDRFSRHFRVRRYPSPTEDTDVVPPRPIGRDGRSSASPSRRPKDFLGRRRSPGTSRLESGHGSPVAAPTRLPSRPVTGRSYHSDPSPSHRPSASPNRPSDPSPRHSRYPSYSSQHPISHVRSSPSSPGPSDSKSKGKAEATGETVDGENGSGNDDPPSQCSRHSESSEELVLSVLYSRSERK